MDKNKSKKSRMKIVWLIIGVIVLIAMIGNINNSANTPVKTDSASKVSSSTSDKPEQTTFQAGDVISFDGKKVSVGAPERNWNSGNEYIVPQSGSEFVKVQVTIENDSSAEVSYNTFDWKMQDSKGVIRDFDSVSYSVDGALESGDLAPGGKVSGFMIFEIPAGDSGLVIQYTSSFWSDKKLKINL